MKDTAMVNAILKSVGAKTSKEFIRSYADSHFNFGFDSFLTDIKQLEFPVGVAKTFSFPNGYSVEVWCTYASKGYADGEYSLTLRKDGKVTFNDDFYDVIEMADTTEVKELLKVASNY